MKMRWHRIIVFIFTCLLMTSFSFKQEEGKGFSSNSEHSSLSSHGSNGGGGENFLTGTKRVRFDLNKPAQVVSHVSTANSVQKNDLESIKDTASSPPSSPSPSAKRIKVGPKKNKTPNPYPKGSIERKMETHRRQVLGSIEAHERRRRNRIASALA